MKDYANPLLLLGVIALMACRSAADSPEAADMLSVWTITLCLTALVVDTCLALAKALTHRRALMSSVWAVSFLIMACCAWRMHTAQLSDDMLAYREGQRTAQDPLARDAEGETLLTRAAALGKLKDVQTLLQQAQPPQSLICEAAMRAAENNHPHILSLLSAYGLTADAAVDGVPLLHAAAQNGACDTLEWLLEHGAAVDARDAEGATALIQAATSASPSAVRLLLKHGADAQLRDAAGCTAGDYAKTEELKDLLSPTPQT